jgi:4-hydroxy-tetrahydrodipicolinate synthase
MFEGLTVAMVTPFRDGGVDWDAVDRLLDHLLEGSVNGVVPAGTTGEGPTLTAAERKELFRRVRRRTQGRAFVLAGTGTNSTAATVEQTRVAREEGADGALVVVPYYNKPTQAGMFAHFTEVADSAGLPVCLYNVPGRCSAGLTPETIRRLAENPRIVAIKEASGSLDQATEICARTPLTVLSGDDSLTLPMLAVGARGVVSVLGNLVPSAIKRMIRAFDAGDTAEALSLHQKLFSLSRALFVESNPGPIKYALAQTGMMGGDLRLPLVSIAESSARIVEAAVGELSPSWLPGGGGVRS